MRENLKYLLLIVLFTIFFICAGPFSAVSGAEERASPQISNNEIQKEIVVDFFYNPTCGSCQKVLPFIEQYETNTSYIRVNYLNIAENQSNVERFHQVQKKFNDLSLHVPIVVIGDQYLTGEENITWNLDIIVQKSIETKNYETIQRASDGQISSNNNQQPDAIHFFYNPSCESCQVVLPFIEQYARDHPDTRIEFDDISGNQRTIEQFGRFKGVYPQEDIHVPVVFIGGTFLQGEENIINGFNSTVELFLANSTFRESGIKSAPVESTYTINPIVLLIAAIGEGLNPCGLLVLALLLVSLMATSSRKMVFFVGLAYICAFFIVRLLSGFAIFSVIQLPGIAKAFTLVAAAIAIIAGIIQIKDGLSKEQKPLLSIPDSKKGLISTYMKEASILGGFMVGILVGIYGMACTAGIYISILGMLYQDLAYGLLYLILYNFIVIIPLIAILLLVIFGLSPETVNAWREERKSLLRLMIGIIMVLMGIIILIPMI
jgi:cytochrome c biogenesis protein CcdA/arsenate reductase-like glutaredoxin family protein